jgi:hypothetical protein
MAIGLWFSSIFFAVAATVSAAVLLRGLGVGPVAFVAPLLFLLSNPLVFRLNLAKAPALSLVALFVGFYAIAKRRLILLGFVSFLYVWLYDGWFLLLFLLGLAILSDAIIGEEIGAATAERGWHWRHRLFGRRSRELIFASVIGIILGHIINPYFPENLYFEWLHIVRIGFLGFRDAIAVGAEWYPYDPFELLAVTATTFLALVIGAVCFFVALMRRRGAGSALPRERARDTLTLLFFTLFALAVTLRSKRNVEYFVPFAVLFSVSALDLFIKARGWLELRTSRPLVGRIGTLTIGAYLGLVLALLAYRDLNGVRRDFINGVSSEKYAGLAAWLVKNTAPGALVFHNDWDDFPYFFQHNTHNRWLVGLDPAFMYVKDPKLFDDWVKITQAKITDRLAERIKNDFGAEYVFLDKDHVSLRAAVNSDRRIKLLYSDDEGAVYKVE